MKYNCIVAYDIRNAIGSNNQIPWRLKNDMKFFKSMTQNNIIVMGRKTYESIGKALPNRINIVLSRDKKYTLSDAIVMHSKQEVDGYCENINDGREVFVIGGAEIYNLFRDDYHTVYVTKVDTEVENADAFFDVTIHHGFEKINLNHFENSEDNQYNFEIIKFYNND